MAGVSQLCMQDIAASPLVELELPAVAVGHIEAAIGEIEAGSLPDLVPVLKTHSRSQILWNLSAPCELRGL
eukprot:5966715-Amphidinium_carterae.1